MLKKNVLIECVLGLMILLYASIISQIFLFVQHNILSNKYKYIQVSIIINEIMFVSGIMIFLFKCTM